MLSALLDLTDYRSYLRKYLPQIYHRVATSSNYLSVKTILLNFRLFTLKPSGRNMRTRNSSTIPVECTFYVKALRNGSKLAGIQN
jgi:hypothetical protein